MSDDRRYVRVYFSIRSDDRFEAIYGDDAALACWLRLLLDADAVWPAPASVPKSAKAGPYRKLIAAGLVEPMPGHLYRIHGLDRERDMRGQSGRNAAAVRWHSERTPNPDADAVLTEQSRAETNRAEQEQDERPDVEAFLGTRFRLPTPNQRTFMDTYCQVFDQTGPERAARLIWSHPDDPIGALKEDLTAFREGRRAEAVASEVPKPRRDKGSGMSRVGDEIAKLYLAPTNGNGETLPLREAIADTLAAKGLA